jgi:hypothetical protein
MKQAIGVAAFILFFAIPAHAQAGGGLGGGNLSSRLPPQPPAHFKISAVGGSDASFIPSGYLPFDRAVAEGQAILDEEKKTPAEAAAAASIVPKPHAKVAVVQDSNGDPIVIKQ